MGIRHMVTKMKAMDWTHKHVYFDRLSYRQSRYTMKLVAGEFSPDELLGGTLTGRQPRPIIVMGNRARKQTTMSDFFQPRAKRYRQTTLHEFFRQL
jgi:hypothetical protein